jgi:hypothetical protein
MAYLFYSNVKENPFKGISLSLNLLLWLLLALVMIVIRDLAYMVRIKVLTDNKLHWKNCFEVIMLWEFCSAIVPQLLGGGFAFAIVILRGEKIKLGILSPALVFSEIPKDFDVSVFYKGDTLTVSVPGTGQVYQLNTKELSVQRLDRTFFRGYNFNANQFLHKDTLFSVGGEGFWMRHNVITYYNTRTREWSLYKEGGKNEQPSSVHFSGYSSKYNQFFRLL